MHQNQINRSHSTHEMSNNLPIKYSYHQKLQQNCDIQHITSLNRLNLTNTALSSQDHAITTSKYVNDYNITLNRSNSRNYSS